MKHLFKQKAVPPINPLLQQYFILKDNDEACSATHELIAANKMQNR